MRGLELNERYYREVVRPILDVHFPDLPHAAALIGWGSEVLGFDDDTSQDHNWGLRFWLFLPDGDAGKVSDEIDRCFADNLPHEFLGCPTAFDYEHERTEARKSGHNINIGTVAGYFRQYLGHGPRAELTAADWLTFPRHKLRGVTGGRVFFDGFGELSSARKRLAYYPRDVWYYMLAAQWTRIFEEQAFIGRCGQVGDDIGSAIIAARQVENLIHLYFLIERVYAPYSKWLGTAFSLLEGVEEIQTAFKGILKAGNWEERQSGLVSAYSIVIGRFNDLGIVSPIANDVSFYFGRSMLTIQDESVIGNLRSAIKNEQVRNIGHLLGSINQLTSASAQLDDAGTVERLKGLY
jgi:Domain of unknown function (DUF4037)